ncbi:hypothetical protein HYC85_024010 [Camellia sinensis]|uniref:Disease resistance protein winged helix domain-containing protein n=1 Tax=Camellia sinensis TaxID=4442 RepID=A0A7J7GIJ6_CAMSI|nr:hypothetical protein HYC85_024010 [Camellia sinensis]
MENRTMVDEEITVGFDDETLTIKKLLAGGKKLLQMISIVGMPGFGLLAKNIKTQESWKQVAQSLRGLYKKIGQRSLEEVAEDYLMDLIQRSMVIVAIKGFDGRIKACRMHDLLRDLCLKKAMEINFLQPIENDNDASPSSLKAVTDHNLPSILENLQTITNLNPYGYVQDLLARTPFLTKLGICGHLLSSMLSNGSSALVIVQAFNTYRCNGVDVSTKYHPESVRKIKEEQESIGNNWLKVLIRKHPWGL